MAVFTSPSQARGSDVQLLPTARLRIMSTLPHLTQRIPTATILGRTSRVSRYLPTAIPLLLIALTELSSPGIFSSFTKPVFLVLQRAASGIQSLVS